MTRKRIDATIEAAPRRKERFFVHWFLDQMSLVGGEGYGIWHGGDR